VLKDFEANDWPTDLLYNVMIHKITVSEELQRRTDEAVKKKCEPVDASTSSANGQRDLSLCRHIGAAKDWFGKNCGGPWPESRTGPEEVKFFNSGKDHCGRKNFQIFAWQLRLLDAKMVPDPIDHFSEEIIKETCKAHKKSKPSGCQGYFYKKEFKTVKEPLSISLSVKLDDGKRQAEPLTALLAFGRAKGRSGKKSLNGSIELRSPSAMIDYLGQLISAQLHIDKPFTPKILIGGRTEYFEVSLFEVRSDRSGLDQAAVAVTHEGQPYYIPRPRYGSEREARSLQAMALIQQVIAFQTSREDLPTSQTLKVVGVR
jgi:hypothetical protein